MSAIFDGITYSGPADISGSDIPSEPGVYLIVTDSAGAQKILGVYGSDDMRRSIADNPKRACWEKNKDSGLGAYYTVIGDASERDRLVRRTVDVRCYKVMCYDPPTDDF